MRAHGVRTSRGSLGCLCASYTARSPAVGGFRRARLFTDQDLPGCRIPVHEAAGADVSGAVLGVTGGAIKRALHLINLDDPAHQSFQVSARRNSPSRLSQTYHSSTIG